MKRPFSDSDTPFLFFPLRQAAFAASRGCTCNPEGAEIADVPLICLKIIKGSQTLPFIIYKVYRIYFRRARVSLIRFIASTMFSSLVA